MPDPHPCFTTPLSEFWAQGLTVAASPHYLRRNAKRQGQAEAFASAASLAARRGQGEDMLPGAEPVWPTLSDVHERLVAGFASRTAKGAESGKGQLKTSPRPSEAKRDRV